MIFNHLRIKEGWKLNAYQQEMLQRNCIYNTTRGNSNATLEWLKIHTRELFKPRNQEGSLIQNIFGTGDQLRVAMLGFPTDPSQ